MDIINIAVRVDGGDYIGTGHIYRCLNILSYIKNCNVLFICKNITDSLKELIEIKYKLILIQKNNTMKITSNKTSWLNDSQIDDSNKTIQIIKNKNFDWLIVDHYSINIEWEEQVKPFVKNIFVIDDYIKKHNCDVLLNVLLKNNNLNTNLLNNSCKILNGKEFIILSKDYTRDFKINKQKLTTINIFMGGADKTNETIKIINICNKLNDKMTFNINYDVIIGGSNKNKDNIINLCKKLKNFNCYFNIKNIKDIFLKSELSIGLAGNTIYEKCILQVPNLLICTNENQKNILNDYIDSGACVYIGTINDNYTDNLKKLIPFYYKNYNELKKLKKNCHAFFNKNQLVNFSKNINLIFNKKLF
jgi:UDP-2,4-diacetamido-2,4,6-trideoxy-beta-L-altropyranose hydrolase